MYSDVNPNKNREKANKSAQIKSNGQLPKNKLGSYF